MARPIQPARALRAIRSLIRNPDDTAQVFEVISALAGNHGARILARMQRSEQGRRILDERRDLLETLSDRERLSALPVGTLGRAYADFMSTEQISADGLVEASAVGDEDPDASEESRLLGARLRDMHDLWHVLTGFGRDLVGEASLLAFTYAQTGHRGVGFIVVAAWLRAGDLPGARRMIFAGWRRGRRAAWLAEQDWEALLERPLDEVRRTLRVEPAPPYQTVRSDGAPQLASA